MHLTQSLPENKSRLLKLLKQDAFIREKVTLSSGKVSDYYIDARRVTLSSEGAYLCARIILDVIKDDHVDGIGGPTLGADPLVGAIGALSFIAQRPVNTFIVRKNPKAHGKQQQVEGPVFKPGSRVVLIDDVATTGRSLVEAIDVLKAISVVVSKAVCLVDRREGAREALAKRQCQLISLFTIEEFVE